MIKDHIRVATPPSERPEIIYDGDCPFCCRWIERWKLITRDHIDYRMSQEVSDLYPEIPTEQFKSAVQLIDPSGRIYSGAEAVFRALACRPRRRIWIHLYLRSKIFALTSEKVYSLVAGNRKLASRISIALWGKQMSPSTYIFSSWLFLRLLAVVALIAFLSYWNQAEGLIGEKGILPFSNDLHNIDRHWERNDMDFSKFWYRPTLLWLSQTDFALHVFFLVGTIAAILLCMGIASSFAALTIWAIYLSLMSVGGVFFTFQWDILLIETMFLAVFLSPIGWIDRLHSRQLPSHLARWLVWLLLFKLIFESGVVKLTYFASNGENTWRNLTALDYHYWTQPIPAWTSWYIHHLPNCMDQISLWFMFAVELVLPFTIFLPRRVRMLGFAGQVLFQLLIIVSGNYGFFNLLTIVLCITLIDDQSLPSFLQQRIGKTHQRETASKVVWIPKLLVLIPFTVIVLYLGVFYLCQDFRGNRINSENSTPGSRNSVGSLIRKIQPLHTVNRYGLFRVMTTNRPEIIIEGSSDGINWKPYIFKFKPIDLLERPKFATPHMPRLDWQMWFAALDVERGRSFQNSPPWLSRFLQEIAKNNPTVISLLQENPFSNEPPRMIRIRLFHYSFTNPQTKKNTGAWWDRTLLNRITIHMRVN